MVPVFEKSKTVRSPDCTATVTGIYNFYWWKLFTEPITVAAKSKARNVFFRSNIEIVGSNPIRCMDVFVYFVFVLPCVDSGRAMG
jgi:hypothetical protein